MAKEPRLTSLRGYIDGQYEHGNIFNNTGLQGRTTDVAQHAHGPGCDHGSPQSDKSKGTQIKNLKRHHLASVKMARTNMSKDSKNE